MDKHKHHWHHTGCHHTVGIEEDCDCGESTGDSYCCGYDDGTECNA